MFLLWLMFKSIAPEMMMGKCFPFDDRHDSFYADRLTYLLQVGC